jgi:uncharacterized membrane protein SpoIIM required for sporulation
MVLESLLNPLSAEKKPWEMFFVGFAYSSIAILLSLWIFLDQASMVMVFFIVMAAIPIMYNVIKLEESKDMVIDHERTLLHEHNKAISFLMYLFIGVVVSSVLWYVVLPSATVDVLFQKQSETIRAINSNTYTSNAINQLAIFSIIFLNNVKVLAFSILFALIYGAGAIFILTWNATVIGTAIGNFIRTNIDHYVTAITLVGQNSYFHIVSLGLLKYALHGIPEIAAYFYGGLAGGILSVAIIRKHYQTQHFRTVLVDFSELVMIALAFLLVAAFLEVYVTPVLF